MPDRLTIGLSADFKTDAAGRLEPVLAELIDPLPHVDYVYFSPSGNGPDGPYVTPADIAPFDAVMALGDPFTAASFSGNDRLATIARWGVGYDRVDVDACTRAGVLLAIAVDAARRPVAEAVVTLMLALAKCLPEKDRIVRTARAGTCAGPPSPLASAAKPWAWSAWATSAPRSSACWRPSTWAASSPVTPMPRPPSPLSWAWNSSTWKPSSASRISSPSTRRSTPRHAA